MGGLELSNISATSTKGKEMLEVVAVVLLGIVILIYFWRMRRSDTMKRKKSRRSWLDA
jgi:ABC-type nickel/cobalt efflux system permease component RcnA